MKKDWYKSQTIQGAVAFLAVVYLQKMGYVDSSMVTEAVKTIGAGWGIYGARDALG